MTEPTCVISIDRSTMVGAPVALVLSGTPGVGEFGITNWREPSLQARIRNSPSDPDSHGEGIALGWSWQETLLTFDIVTDASATENEARQNAATLRAAVSRLSYSVTVTVNGAAAETWTCKPGSVVPKDDRSYADLVDHNPVWSVTIPCHPVRSVA